MTNSLSEIRSDLSAFRDETRKQFNQIKALALLNVGLTAIALWKVFDLSREVEAMSNALTALPGLN